MLKLIVDTLIHKAPLSTTLRFLLRNLDWITIFNLHKKFTHNAPECPVNAMGLRFPNAVGLTSGFDINAERIMCIGAFGFGHVSAGPMTARRIEGNALKSYKKSGEGRITHSTLWPNKGIFTFDKPIQSHEGFKLRGGVTGMTLALNTAIPLAQALKELVIALEKIYATLDYFTFLLPENLQETKEILEVLSHAREKLTVKTGKKKPFLLKLSSDLTKDEIKTLVGALLEADFEGIETAHSETQLFSNGEGIEVMHAGHIKETLATLKTLKSLSKEKLTLVAAGGIMTNEDALSCIKAGASLVNLDVGLLCKGPRLVTDIIETLYDYNEDTRKKRCSSRS